MARHLVVGNQTLLSDELAAVLVQRTASDDGCLIHVVIPQTPLDHYRDPTGEVPRRFHEMRDTDETVAEHRLAVVLGEYARFEATVTGEVGSADPVRAVVDVLGEQDFDEVVLSTFPEGISRWLGRGITDQLSREVDVPITHVVSRRANEERERQRRYDEVVRSLRAGES